jgi:muconate cycloisomerase
MAPFRAVAATAGSRIRKVEVLPVAIEFRTAFNIGVGNVGGKGQPGKYVFVKIETEDGQFGWGATTTVPNWSYETVEAVVGTLEHHLAPLAIGRTAFEWNVLKKRMDETIRPAVSNGAPFAKSALEIAFLDLAGKMTGQPIHRLLGGKLHDTIDLCYAVSIDEPQAMAGLPLFQSEGFRRRR